MAQNVPGGYLLGIGPHANASGELVRIFSRFPYEELVKLSVASAEVLSDSLAVALEQKEAVKKDEVSGVPV